MLKQTDTKNAQVINETRPSGYVNRRMTEHNKWQLSSKSVGTLSILMWIVPEWNS